MAKRMTSRSARLLDEPLRERAGAVRESYSFEWCKLNSRAIRADALKRLGIFFFADPG